MQCHSFMIITLHMQHNRQLARVLRAHSFSGAKSHSTTLPSSPDVQATVRLNMDTPLMARSCLLREHNGGEAGVSNRGCARRRPHVRPHRI